jgi:hypothetical protein
VALDVDGLGVRLALEVLAGFYVTHCDGFHCDAPISG